MPQVLTLEGVKAAARKAHAEKRLTAQHTEAVHRKCIYQIGEYHCAVGAALTPSMLLALSASGYLGSGVNKLVEIEAIEVEDHELPLIQDIQSLHDCWADASRNYGERSSAAKDTEQAFLAAIAA